MIEQITSVQNRLIKDTANLADKKYRQQTGLFLLEGEKMLLEAINSHWQLQHIFILPDIYDKLANDTKEHLANAGKIYFVTEQVLAKISAVTTSQGIVATAVMQNTLVKPETTDDSLIIVLDSVSDPGNIGTIVRSALAAGVFMLLLTDNCADIYSPKVVRASMGSIFRMPFAYLTSKDILNFLQTQGYDIIVTHIGDAKELYNFDFKGRKAVILGNEAHGVSKFFLDSSQERLFIPQNTDIQSLNVGVAGSIIMYEALRQRRM